MHLPVCQLTILLALAAVAAGTSCAPRPVPLTPAFCARPPVGHVIPASYLGTWYQIFVNARALRISASTCVAARYTDSGRGVIGVLNCESSPSDAKAQCVVGAAKARPGGGTSGRLEVRFGGGSPGPYNIAALLGDAEYGYYAAAVFSCNVVDGKPRTAWFFLARNPYRPYVTLWELTQRLSCMGYDVYSERLLMTKQGKGCKYWFRAAGYDVNPPRGPRRG